MIFKLELNSFSDAQSINIRNVISSMLLVAHELPQVQQLLINIIWLMIETGYIFAIRDRRKFIKGATLPNFSSIIMCENLQYN